MNSVCVLDFFGWLFLLFIRIREMNEDTLKSKVQRGDGMHHQKENLQHADCTPILVYHYHYYKAIVILLICYY